MEEAGTIKILLVDDSKTMRNVQRGVLTQLGYAQIQEATVGEDALSKLAAFRPHLLLVSWSSSDHKELAFVRQYRQQGGTLPILMLSSETEKARVLEAIKSGVNNYLLMPFTPEQLAQRIKDTLDRAALFGTRIDRRGG